MFEIVPTQSHSDGDNKLPPLETKSSLKLVVSNPDLFQETSASQTPDSAARASFAATVRVKGPCLYEMTLEDPSHYLACDLFLEVEESSQKYGERAVICHFPTLSDEELNGFVEEDETLYGIIMIQFQMKIMEQLFLFCAAHDASILVIFADDMQADALGVYQDFLAYEDQTLTSKGEKTEMVIPANRGTFDAWIDLMAKTTAEFQQTLWRKQKTNSTIRQYLKMQSFFSGTS